MSIELLEDEVLIEKEDAISDNESKKSSSVSSNKNSSESLKEEQRAKIREVIEAESATDDPSAVTAQDETFDSNLDEKSVKLPHLPSPFDSKYPKSRGGDRWEKVCKDGHCMISEISPGEGSENVPVLHRVYVNCEGRLQDGTVFLDYNVEELDFTLGQAQVPKGLEMAVCQMKLNQHCLIRCYSDYGYSTTRRPKNVPADAMLFMDVKILRWEKEKNLHEMNLDDKKSYVQLRRERGKELFQSGSKPRSAVKQYDKAITVLESIESHKVEMKVDTWKKKMLALFLTNQAQCWMKVPDYAKVIECCNKALTLHPTYLKALFRRAEARKAREEYDEAERDYKKLLEVNDQLQKQDSNSSDADGIGIENTVDELVLLICRNSIRDIGARRAKLNNLSRKKLDGFMKNSSASLYDDLPDVGPDSAKDAKASPKDGEPDGKPWDESAEKWWEEEMKNNKKPQYFLQSVIEPVVNFFRSWCGTKKEASGKKND